ncbi:hypothetical protein IWX75_002919 [Arthrobacter sp. CAN_A6]
MSLTQTLRTLIEDADAGLATTDDLHNALLDLEMALDMPVTLPSEVPV